VHKRSHGSELRPQDWPKLVVQCVPGKFSRQIKTRTMNEHLYICKRGCTQHLRRSVYTKLEVCAARHKIWCRATQNLVPCDTKFGAVGHTIRCRATQNSVPCDTKFGAVRHKIWCRATQNLVLRDTKFGRTTQFLVGRHNFFPATQIERLLFVSHKFGCMTQNLCFV
jgi:hypothetical protein